MGCRVDGSKTLVCSKAVAGGFEPGPIKIEIKEITKNKFNLSQLLLVEEIVDLLGLGHNEFDVHKNTTVTPAGKPLLNKDLRGKPRKIDWKHRTAIGMLTYL
jgi:hypothetical protein